MHDWKSVGQLVGAFGGNWMRLGTAIIGLALVSLLRRLLPPEQRQRSAPTAVLLSIGLLLGLFGLLLASSGTQTSTTGKVVGLLATFFVALGAVNLIILLVFEVVPRHSRIRLPTILRDIIQMVSLVVILFGALSTSGAANLVSFITTSAVLTAVVGLALQSTLSNLFAGVVMHMDRTMSEGDWIQLGTRTGSIAEIRWRSTVLRTTDGDNLIVPNAQLLSQEVYNFSRPLPRHRLWVRVTFSYRHPPTEVKEVLTAAARSTPGVLPQPAPDCLPVEFGDSGVIYALRFWVADVSHRVEIEGEVRSRIWYAAQRAVLEIPFPMRNVQLFEPGRAEARRLPPDLGVTPSAGAVLEGIDLFANLDPADREQLAQNMRLVRFGAGEPIIRQGEPGDSLFIIIKGDVLVSLSASGIDQSVTNLRPGDLFGEMSLLTGEPRSATCSARSDVVCYVVDHRALKPLLSQRPQLAEHLSSVLLSRQATLEKKGGELSARAAARADHRNRLLGRIRSFFELR